MKIKSNPMWVTKVHGSLSKLSNLCNGLVLSLTFILMHCILVDASAQKNEQVVVIAKLRIDSLQLDRFNAALKEDIETSIRVEAGILAMYAVSEKDHPANITVFEIYSGPEAFNAHGETAHFKKYRTITKNMVKSLELIDTVPIALGQKSVSLKLAI